MRPAGSARPAVWRSRRCWRCCARRAPRRRMTRWRRCSRRRAQQCAQPTDRLERILCGKPAAGRRARLLSAVRHAREQNACRLRARHRPRRSPSASASRSSSSASTPRRASRCWARTASTWCWRPWGTPPSATASSASSGRITTSRRRRWSGPRRCGSADWNDVATRTICVAVGNVSNAELVSHNARLMLFDEAGVLPDRLKDETCTLAAQDDSFFAYYFTDPAFADRFEQKFGFAQVPWGMGVARTGSDKLARALDLLSQIFHRDGNVPRDRPRKSHPHGLPRAPAARLAAARMQHRRGQHQHGLRPAGAQLELKPTPFAGTVRRPRTGSRSGSASTSPCRCSRPRRPSRCS